ncbi:hypothetical protein [Treponema denticola]|uniref:hypothetical protein n=1 Tax=Treponema denticola TaxID=158 RepID=UPI0001FD3B0C|nr:hypothetical protein [Treponema denticola]EGC77707.1 hypothetical protein HMPREF9353_01286 [Treponema denticola F0402]
MKTKFSIFSHPNYLTRTAIEAECAVPILVYFYLLCNNKSYKKPSGFLRTEPLSSYFEDRMGIGEGNNQQRFEVKKLLSDKSVFPSLTTAPVNDEAKKHNENLPGMGGVFNVVNLHVYHYAGYSQRSFELYNLVKYVDPDGRDIEESPIVSGSLAILLAARGSIGFAKDSNNHIALYIKGELGLGAGTDIDVKKGLSNALGNVGKILTLLDNGNSVLNLIVNAINVPEDTGEGNFNGILNFVPDNYSNWSGNLPTEGAFFYGSTN